MGWWAGGLGMQVEVGVDQEGGRGLLRWSYVNVSVRKEVQIMSVEEVSMMWEESVEAREFLSLQDALISPAFNLARGAIGLCR